MVEKLSRDQLQQASATWEALLRVFNSLNRQFSTDGSFDELPMREYDILYTLAKAGEPMTQSELLEGVVLSQPAVSRMLKRLECQGLLERRAHRGDGRAALFSLTELGREKQRKIGKLHGKAIARRLYENLDDSEAVELARLALKLLGSPKDEMEKK
ncbi:MarR family winged helix-turn-helix transcriptional regulator [Actinomyces minihominis]|uniref:MarR family winged helix-turn-helix transcriptional regulator n=1 Tax=Actinomyces minihominis TaxID=2002838 RepID=UPI0013ED9A24|nr:MarR family transcriptional regulator [Actinomyces minihominis]